ncbi:MAG: hypothetical protein JXB88_07615 [Spirochaetales bacterium]|nr:hypothetical protein [Spirochaetales bacterium]
MKIINDIDNNKINQISEILYEGFREKINAIIKEKGKALAVIRKMINPDMGFYAVDENEDIIGVIGTVTKHKSFYGLKFKNIMEDQYKSPGKKIV